MTAVNARNTTSSTTTSSSSKPWYIRGGPHSSFPRVLESFLSWALALSCLSVAFWYYHLDRWRLRARTETDSNTDNDETTTTSAARIPLTTHSRNEWSTVSSSYEGFRSRYHQLMHILASNNNSNNNKNTIDDEKARIIDFLRTDGPARRLVSLLFADDPIDYNNYESSSSPSSTTLIACKRQQKRIWFDRLCAEDPKASLFVESIRNAWPRLLELPSSDENCAYKYKYDISLIVPAYKEDGSLLATKLQASLDNLATTRGSGKNKRLQSRIEIIVVHAVDQESDQLYHSLFAEAVRNQIDTTTRLTILRYSDGGGRGPTLNYGANHASGRILAFLHGDTRLATKGWDLAIRNELELEFKWEDTAIPSNKSCSNNSTTSKTTTTTTTTAKRRTTCCTFSFAIDTSKDALRIETTKKMNSTRTVPQPIDNNSNNKHSHANYYYPPGLKAIEVTANLRTRWFSLPYGDQCLCLPANVFYFLGGYPDQCLMEDYELVRLLRMRSSCRVASINSNNNSNSNSNNERERIKILTDHRAVCSPRRWQRHGVLYVTYTNSHCVKRYNKGILTPDELFCEYYGTTTGPPRKHKTSPWELELPTTSTRG